jgi:hypothetical protein
LAEVIDGCLEVTDEPGRRIDEPALLAVAHVVKEYRGTFMNTASFDGCPAGWTFLEPEALQGPADNLLAHCCIGSKLAG